MYIKKVKKQNGRTKTVYEYLHLVESVRTENGPRQRLILNLGNIDIDPSQYNALAKRIESILTGQKNIFDIDAELEKHANNVAKKIFKKQAQEISSDTDSDFQNIDTKSLEVHSPQSLGAEYICHSIWKELKLNEFFKSNGVSEHVTPIIESLVVGRLIEPASERHTKTWVENRSALYELTGFPLRRSLNSYYRAGDKLYSLKDAIENHLSSKERDLFSLTEKMFFFDLTNTYFEGEALKNPKAKRGRSKEKRSDCKLVTLGLIIDEAGFSKYSRVFPGNQSEPKTLETMIKELENKTCSKDVKHTIVMDAGIATGENLKFLKENNYHYIVVNRGKVPFNKDYTDMKVIREDPAKGIKIEIKRFIEEDEIYIFCKSEKKKDKESSMRNRVENLFLEKMEYYRDGLLKPRRMKNYKKIMEVIGRLKEKYPKAAKLYNIEVVPEKDKLSDDPKLCVVDIKWEKKDSLYEKEIEGEGSYILRTDRLDLSDKEIWETYIMLGRIEYAFKCMKSHLGLRPNFHQVEDRVDAHLFISVLAYHILNIVEYRMRYKGDHSSWATIRDIMRTHERVTISYRSKNDKGIIKQEFVRINSTLEPEQLEIYRKLELNPIPLPRRKLSQQV